MVARPGESRQDATYEGIGEWLSGCAYQLIQVPTVSQMFGGAPLAQEVGDTLAAHGISLITLYGWYEILCQTSLY